MKQIALLAAAALALAACARDEAEPTADNALNADLIDTGAVNETLPPPPAPVADTAPDDAPAPTPIEEPVIEPTQVQDDADASGMTSRIDRTDEEGEASTTTNEAGEAQ